MCKKARKYVLNYYKLYLCGYIMGALTVLLSGCPLMSLY